MTWPDGWPQGSYTLAPLRAALVADDEATAAGVPGVPTVTVGDEHFWGDDQLPAAAAAAAAARAHT